MLIMKKKIIEKPFQILLILVFILNFNYSYAADGSIVVKIDKGEIKGYIKNEVLYFKGIPYAKPPVGELRWRAPIEAEPWSNIKDATQFGAVCIQPKINKKFTPWLENQSEDCLSINIWSPNNIEENKVKPLPVMVWIHGGAFKIGSGSLPVYDGTSFAESGVVLVTLNYRLGNLGFFGHSAITEGKNSERTGNFGLLDQISALEWVQKNIIAFGGDKNNVTIFGESAGAVSVNYLMTLPESKGLFHQAIAQSGGGLQIPIDKNKSQKRKPSEKKRTKKLLKDWQISGHKNIANKLRELPAKVTLKTSAKFTLGGGPYIDGHFLKRTIGESFASGKQHDLPYLAGSNSFEGSLMKKVMAKKDPTLIFWTFGWDRNKAKSLYTENGASEIDAAFEFFGDAFFTAGARYVVEKMGSKHAKSWLYYFSYVTTNQRDVVKGVAHGAEILYVFDTLSKWQHKNSVYIEEDDKAMSRKVHAYWINFATTGNPNGEELEFWPAYESEHPTTLEFAIAGVSPKQDFKSKKLTFIIDHHKNNNSNLK